MHVFVARETGHGAEALPPSQHSQGRVRVVVSSTDPGVPNWLDTEGRPVGMAVYRYVGAITKPQPTAEVVAVHDIRRALPTTHPSTSPDERRRLLTARSLGAQRRWG